MGLLSPTPNYAVRPGEVEFIPEIGNQYQPLRTILYTYFHYKFETSLGLTAQFGVGGGFFYTSLQIRNPRNGEMNGKLPEITVVECL